eukprot:SAG11_NODE_25459_length_358_cov_1.189189_1_plen_90_part_01
MPRSRTDGCGQHVDAAMRACIRVEASKHNKGMTALLRLYREVVVNKDEFLECLVFRSFRERGCERGRDVVTHPVVAEVYHGAVHLHLCTH